MISAPLVLAVIASAYLAGAVIAVSRSTPDYSPVRQTISELAEHGSRRSRQVSLGIFLPVGAILSVVAWLLQSDHSPIAALSLSIAIGYVIAAGFPCDPGSPAVGSMRQAVHNLGGAIEYLGGAASLLWISDSAGHVYRIAGIVVAVSAVAISFESSIRGLVQRIAESCLFASLVAVLWAARPNMPW